MMRHVLCLLSVFAIPIFSQTVLNPGVDLQTAVNNAAPGATLLLNAGTYSLSTTLLIQKALTIRSNTAGQKPVLQVASGFTGVDIKSSNVTLESLRVAGIGWGIYAGNGSTAMSNVVLRSLSINAAGANGGHGIYLGNVTNGVIDSCIIETAPITGIIVDAGSTGATVINNLVSAAGVHGIGITNSDSVIVAGNTIASANQFGIILGGSKFSRVDRNSILGAKQDGIVVTRDDATVSLSHSNYIGRNVVVSNGLSTGNPEGTGIWLNSESNGVLVYGNTTSGAPENGFTIFNSSNSWFWGNVTSNNGQGGILIYGPVGLPYSVGPAPANNFVQGNHTATPTTNAGLYMNASTGTVAFNNMFRNGPAGVFMQNSSGNQLFLNLLRSNGEGFHALAGSTSSAYFLNRHIDPVPNFAEPGTSVVYDAGPVVGGNFQAGGKVLTDNNPYSNEQLGRQPSVGVVLPAAGSIVASSSRKTIEWRSTACTYVDIYYKSAGTGQQVIASDYPDVGTYQWEVPALAAASDYTIVVDCNNSAGASLGVSGSSATFTVSTAGLQLLSPQGNHRVPSGGTTKVTWSRTTGSPAAVNVLYRATPGAALTPLANNITSNDVTVTVPAGGSSQGAFFVQFAANPAVGDSTDGFVNVTSGAPAVSGPSGNIGIGTLQLVQWNSHSNSYYVDIEYFDTTAGVYRGLATNLPDFGRFYFLGPDKAMTGSFLRVRFKTSALAAITTANSGTFNTVVAGVPGGGNTNPAAPTVVSASPASGSGITQSFTATYADPNGGIDIATAFFMVTSVSPDASDSCFVEYNRASNSFRLMGDAGNAWSNPIPAGSGSVSNSRCTLNGAGASGSVSGNNLSVTFPLTFSQTPPETRNTFGLAIDTGGLNSGWQALGTWTIPGGGPSLPDLVSLTPTTGAGASGTFTAVFRHPGGPPKHYLGYMLFLPLPNVVSFQAQGSCLVEYNRISNGMRLINNAGNGWIGPPEGVPVSGATAPLSNNACTVTVSGVAVSFSGTDMIVSVPVTFNAPGVSLVLGTFLQEQDTTGAWTDFRQYGNWVVPGAPTKPGPFIVGSSPQSGAGSSTTLSVTVGHTGGIPALGDVHIRYNTSIVGGVPCHIVYFSQSNQMALVNDAQNALVGPAPLGTALNTGRCSIGAGASRVVSGNNLTITMPVGFNVGQFGGAKNLYVTGFDVNGAVTHWVQTGTWTVQ